MAQQDRLLLLSKRINTLREGYRERYGIAIIEVKLEVKHINSIVLTGVVLLAKQAEAIEQLVREEGWQVENQLKVLAEPENRVEMGWGKVNSRVVNMYQNISELINNDFQRETWYNNISNQITMDDGPLRILFEEQGWLLVQADDLTLGWVPSARVDLIDNGHKAWQNIQRAAVGHLTKLDRSWSEEAFYTLACGYLGTPYLGGGSTGAGLDCSGLVQRVYRQMFGVILPKHSLDQKRVGVSISVDELRVGDLIFLYTVNQEPALSHVGIYLSEQEILSARYPVGKTIIEPLDKFIEPQSHDDKVEMRRIIEAPS